MKVWGVFLSLTLSASVTFGGAITFGALGPRPGNEVARHQLRMECQNLLTLDATPAAGEIAAHRLAARILLIMSGLSPALKEDSTHKTNQPQAELRSELAGYYLTTGFAVHPPIQPTATSKWMGKDPTYFSKFVVTPGFRNSIWEPNKEIAPYLKLRYDSMKQVRNGDEFQGLLDVTKRAISRNLLNHTLRVWEIFNPPAGHIIKSSMTGASYIQYDGAGTWNAKVPWHEIDVKVHEPTRIILDKIRPFGPVSQREIKTLTDLMSHRKVSPETPEEILTERAHLLVRRFLYIYLPDIIAHRDYLFNEYLDRREKHFTYIGETPRSNRLVQNILRLANGEEIVAPTHEPPRQVTDNRPPPPAPMRIAAVKAPPEPTYFAIEDLDRQLADWTNENLGPIENARRFLPLLDKVIDSLVVSTYRASFTYINENSLDAEVGGLQSKLQDSAGPLRQQAVELAKVEASLNPYLKNLIESLQDTNLEDSTLPQSLKDLESEETELLLISLKQAATMLAGRLELQKRWITSVLQLEALVRQYRQDLASGLPVQPEQPAQLLEAIRQFEQVIAGKSPTP